MWKPYENRNNMQKKKWKKINNPLLLIIIQKAMSARGETGQKMTIMTPMRTTS